MSDRERTQRQGYRLWRRLPNGIEIHLRHDGRDSRGYKALAGDECVGWWGQYKNCPPCGHVRGNFAVVQDDRHGPARTLQGWLAAIAAI